MLRTIRLYGALGKKYGKVHKMHVASVSEAIRALCANFKEFRHDVVNAKVAGYEVWDGKHSLGEDDKEYFHKHGEADIKIIPRIKGGSNTAKIIIGAAMIVIGLMMAPATAGSSLALVKTGLVMMGASLVLSGVIGMMAPTASGVSVDGTDDLNTTSYIFSNTVNTTKQGNPVFICYGKHLLGSQVISAALTTSDIAI